jgi:hypothetical protein
MLQRRRGSTRVGERKLKPLFHHPPFFLSCLLERLEKLPHPLSTLCSVYNIVIKEKRAY